MPDKPRVLFLGMNEHNQQELQTIENADDYSFSFIFDPTKIQQQEHLNVPALEQQARQQIESYGIPDAVVSFFDFPFTLLSFWLCDEYNLKGPSLEQGLKCEHKYWSRLEQQKAIPEHTPDFAAVNPFTQTRIEDVEVKPPFWIKPIKSFSSQLGFKVTDQQSYDYALKHIQEGIGRFKAPFDFFLNKINLPKYIKGIDGSHCLAEGMVSGHQCTVSGYVYENEVTIYGVVDSENYPNTPSFYYYLLPSELPGAVQQQLGEASKKIIRQTGFNNSTFNIEFFYNRVTGAIYLLEINPRMSQSHADLYAKVKGHSNHQVLIKLGLGEQPDFKHRQGDYGCAAKFLHRVFEDGQVTRAPSPEKIAGTEEKFRGTHIDLAIKNGLRLSDLPLQDSYSFALGSIITGAPSKEKLLQKYDHILQELDIAIEPVAKK